MDIIQRGNKTPEDRTERGKTFKRERRSKFKRLVYLPLRTFKGTSRHFWLGRSDSLAKAELSELPTFFRQCILRGRPCPTVL